MQLRAAQARHGAGEKEFPGFTTYFQSFVRTVYYKFSLFYANAELSRSVELPVDLIEEAALIKKTAPLSKISKMEQKTRFKREQKSERRGRTV